MTLTVNLPEQKFQMHNRAMLFWNPCINIEVMAQISSIYDHFIIWSLNVTLTFNYLHKCFKWHFYISRTKLFWNPCINVKIMAQTSSIYDHFIIWPSSVTLTFNIPEQMFKWHCYSSKKTAAPNYWNSCINVEVMAWTNPEGCLLVGKHHTCKMHAPQCTHIHRTEIVTIMSRSPQAGLTKWWQNVEIVYLPLRDDLNQMWLPTFYKKGHTTKEMSSPTFCRKWETICWHSQLSMFQSQSSSNTTEISK